MTRARWTIAVLTLTEAALGQINSYDLVISNEISPASPVATIELWARFDPQFYAFGAGYLALHATTDVGGFADPELVLVQPGTDAGDVENDGDSVTGIVVGQICNWNGIVPDTSNPLLLWRATWSTADFSPRTIDLSTASDDYYLFINEVCQTESFINNNFAEAVGQIKIVPSPSAIPVLALGGGLTGRRRRRRATW